MHTLQHLEQLTQRALQAAGASPEQAAPTARALVAAESQGLASHGLSRVPMYAAHLRAGRVVGDAVPKVIAEKSAAVLVDAGDGFAFPACALAVREAIARARECGIAIGAVTHSHHFGAAAYHLQPVAEAGMVGLAFGNSPAAMPAAGGKRAIFGTNPIAAAFPRGAGCGQPIMVDLSLSAAARGKIMVAAKKGEAIPLGWALDADGQPTTDPKAALAGSMLPVGGTKGAMLALVVELLVSALTGARFGLEADSLLEAQGNQPRLGQTFIVIDPGALSGAEVYGERVEALLGAILADEGVRIPGYRRNDLAGKAAADGIDISEATLAPVKALADTFKG